MKAKPYQRQAVEAWFRADVKGRGLRDVAYGPDVRECPSCKDMVPPDGYFAAHRAVGRCILCVQEADRRGAPARVNSPDPLPAIFPDNTPLLLEPTPEVELQEDNGLVLAPEAPAWHPNGTRVENPPMFGGPPANLLSFDVRLRACPIHRELAHYCGPKQAGSSRSPSQRHIPNKRERGV